MAEVNMVVVKRGNDVLFSYPKAQAFNIQSTGEGLIFNLKCGAFINLSDPYLPSEFKEIISSTVSNVTVDASVVIDLANRRTPVSFTM